MPKGSGPSGPSGASGASGPSGSHAARASKAKVSRAEQSAANSALKVVVAQAKADAVTEKKAAADALKLVKARVECDEGITIKGSVAVDAHEAVAPQATDTLEAVVAPQLQPPPGL